MNEPLSAITMGVPTQNILRGGIKHRPEMPKPILRGIASSMGHPSKHPTSEDGRWLKGT